MSRTFTIESVYNSSDAKLHFPVEDIFLKLLVELPKKLLPKSIDKRVIPVVFL